MRIPTSTRRGVTGRAVALLVLPLLALGACGDDDTTSGLDTTTTSTTTTTAPGGGGTDAASVRDSLLAAAASALQGKSLAAGADNRAATTAVVDAWKARLPGIVVSGTQVEAAAGPAPRVSTNVVSGIGTVNDKDVPGPNNPYWVVIAVKDSTGKCAGGSLRGFPVPSQEKKFDVTGRCNAATASAQG